MRLPTAVLALLLVPSLVCMPAPEAARADSYDEVEKRLKTTGVDAALARRITEAIERGAAWTRKHQRRSGQIAPLERRNWSPGEVALLTLGLAHTGAPADVEAAQRSLAWLRRSSRKELVGKTYEAALLALLLHALAPDDELLEDIQQRFARGYEARGGHWDYRPVGGSGTPNLSTSQFAALGLAAAERAGLPRPHAVWANHLRPLLASQTADGSFPYYGIDQGKQEIGYPAGTYMGLASLALGRPEPEIESARGRREAGEQDRAMNDGQFALRRHVRWTLRARQRALPGGYRHYRLYALEKACIFLDLDALGDVDWYAEGARELLDTQQADGSWSAAAAAAADPRARPGEAVATGFSLLFLLRASEVYRPTTPRHPWRETPPETGPVTPDHDDGGGGIDIQPPPPQIDDPDAWDLPLDVARAVLEQARAHPLSDDRPTLARLRHDLSTLRGILAAYRQADGDDRFAKQAFLREAEGWLLGLALPFDGGRISKDAWRVAIATDVLDVLANARPEAATALQELIARVLRDKPNARRHVRVGWFGAAFDALRRISPSDEVRAWITAHGLSPDPDDHVFTVPAILALERMPPDTEAAQIAGVHGILRRIHPMLRADDNHRHRGGILVDLLLMAQAWGTLGDEPIGLHGHAEMLRGLYAATR